MLPTAPRLAERLLRLEARLVQPFAAISRVESRAGALATAAVLAIVSVAASLVAVFHLGELLGLSTGWRTVTVASVITWVVTNDIVEPLGLRLRDLVGSLVGEVDTYRPVAAAWISVARAGAFVPSVLLAASSWSRSVPLAATVGLFALGLVASQAESVARRRAWALGDAADLPPSGTRSLGRDEELVHALTSGSRVGGDTSPR